MSVQPVGFFLSRDLFTDTYIYDTNILLTIYLEIPAVIPISHIASKKYMHSSTILVAIKVSTVLFVTTIIKSYVYITSKHNICLNYKNSITKRTTNKHIGHLSMCHIISQQSRLSPKYLNIRYIYILVYTYLDILCYIFTLVRSKSDRDFFG